MPHKPRPNATNPTWRPRRHAPYQRNWPAQNRSFPSDRSFPSNRPFASNCSVPSNCSLPSQGPRPGDSSPNSFLQQYSSPQNVSNRSDPPILFHHQHLQITPDQSQIRSRGIEEITVATLERLRYIYLRSGITIYDIQSEKESSKFDQEFDRGFQMWRVFIACLPIFLGMSNQTNREHPDIRRLLRETRIEGLKLAIRHVGWVQMESWVRYCLKEELYTSRSRLLSHIGALNSYDQLSSLEWLKMIPQTAEKLVDVCPNAQVLITTCCVENFQDACFELAKKCMPQSLAEYGWACSERVELALWKKVFMSSDARLVRPYLDFKGAQELAGEGFTVGLLWRSVIDIRNLDAHNEEISMEHFLAIATCGRIFMRLLRDKTREDFFIRLDQKVRAVEAWSKRDIEVSRAALVQTFKELEGKRLHHQRLIKAKELATHEMQRGREYRRMGISNDLEESYTAEQLQIRKNKRRLREEAWAEEEAKFNEWMDSPFSVQPPHSLSSLSLGPKSNTAFSSMPHGEGDRDKALMELFQNSRYEFHLGPELQNQEAED